jgi:putative transposase
MLPLHARRSLVEPTNEQLSIMRQCTLLGLARSSWYYEPVPVDPRTLALMKAIDREYTAHPFFGVRKITQAMREHGLEVNHKKVARLMRQMGIQAIYAAPKTSIPAQNHKIYPYLLKDVEITKADQVWSSDLTYVPMETGFMYLVAVIDWFSRFVLAWGVSNTQDADFAASILQKALRNGKPKIFNTDQGSQFTSEVFTQHLIKANIAISMDGRGRALDNVFIERLWRSVKYEDIYLHNYRTVAELISGLNTYFHFYNYQRYHQSLDNRTPARVYHINSRHRISPGLPRR